MPNKYGYPPDEDEPTPDTLRQELETVFHRHNDLFRDDVLGPYAVAVALHQTDEMRAKLNIELEFVHETDGLAGFDLGDGAAGALLGAADAGEADIEAWLADAEDGDSLAMVDDTTGDVIQVRQRGGGE